MNPDEWYPGWVKAHCTATGGDARTRDALLSPLVRDVLLDSGRTTPGELGEVTVRLLARHETPQFPAQHADAIGNELVRLREERRAVVVPPPGDFAPDCPACGGSGLAVIPVRACVLRGTLILHPEHKRVVTVAVLCDRPGCLPGQRAVDDEGRRPLDERKPRRVKLSQCERAAGGVDLPQLLREYEHETARRARKGGEPGPLTPNLDAVLDAAKHRRVA